MIFVTIGNHYMGFERLLRKMDQIAGSIDEKVIMQIGFSKYEPVNAEYFTFMDNFEEIKTLNREARVIVSHAGVGSIITALELKTPIILVPRLKKYSEHSDDHQLEIVAKMSHNPNIKAVKDVDELDGCLKEDFVYKENGANESKLVDSLKKYFSKN